MSNDFNPLKDIFSNLDVNKIQDNTANFFSSVIRSNGRNFNALKDCFQDGVTIQKDLKSIKYDKNSDNSDTSNKVKLSKKSDNKTYEYECPFPQYSKGVTVTIDELCPFPKKDTPIEPIEVPNQEEVKKIDPLTKIEENEVSIEDVQILGDKDDNQEDTTIQVECQEVAEPPKEETKPMKFANGIDPFSSFDDTEPVKEETNIQDTCPKDIETITEEPKDVKPLTDREVIDKTSSMWKYNKIDDTIEVYPEYITQKGSTPYADILVSRVRGKKHKHNGTNCDDYFDFSLVGNCCIVAVSDGAGSKMYSRIGAKEVTTEYVKSMSSSLKALLKDNAFLEGLSYPVTDSLFNKSCSSIALELQNAIKCAYSSLLCKYEEISKKWDYIKPLERDIVLNDLSCTLLTAVIIPIETSNGVETFIATLQIGDGLICSMNEENPFDNCTKVLGVSDSGNFSGETEFITSANMMEQSNLMRRIKIMKGKSSAIMLATDGVADDYFPNDTKCCMLYSDLKLNGIIPVDIKDDAPIKIVPPIRQQKTIEENPRDVSIAYSEDIQEFFKISNETLWKDKSFIENAVSVYNKCFSSDRSKNLESWLDNYTKRGSFDDRTLFIYRPLK